MILKIIAFFYVRTVYYIFLCKTRARAFFYWHPGYHGINKYDDSDFHRSLINLTKCFLDFVFRYRYRYLKLLYTVYTSILDNICPLPHSIRSDLFRIKVKPVLRIFILTLVDVCFTNFSKDSIFSSSGRVFSFTIPYQKWTLPQKNFFFFYNSSLYFLQNDLFRENDPTPHIVVT